MTPKILALAAALVLCGASAAWAQGAPDAGPHAPARGGAHGTASGTHRPPGGTKAYASVPHDHPLFKRHGYARLHHPHHRYHHRRHHG